MPAQSLALSPPQPPSPPPSPTPGAIDPARLEALAPLLVELVDRLDAMVAYWDRDEVCVFANAAYRQWFGRDGRELVGTRLRDLLGPLYALNEPHIRAAYAGERQVFERAISLPDGSGVRHSLATYLPRIVDGRVEGMFVHVADVSPLKRLEEELREAKARAERLAVHDPLTGLPNRSQLHERLAQAVRRSVEQGTGCAVLAVDLDEFKAINDTRGHAAGDHVLVEAARRLADAMRGQDVVIRLGGDEFVVIAQDLEAVADATALAARLVRACADPVDCGDDGPPARVGASIGVAVCPWHARSAPALLEAADRALYAAKRAGRGRWSMAEPAP